MCELTEPLTGQSADAVAAKLPELNRFPRLSSARLSPLFSKSAWKILIARARFGWSERTHVHWWYSAGSNARGEVQSAASDGLLTLVCASMGRNVGTDSDPPALAMNSIAVRNPTPSAKIAPQIIEN